MDSSPYNGNVNFTHPQVEIFRSFFLLLDTKDVVKNDGNQMPLGKKNGYWFPAFIKITTK